MHSGIVAVVIDRYKDIVLADMNSISFGDDQEGLEELWDKIFQKERLNDVIGEGIAGALASGDGAFKITADECSKYPIVEFYDAENVDFVYVHSRLKGNDSNFILTIKTEIRIFGWKRHMAMDISYTNCTMMQGKKRS